MVWQKARISSKVLFGGREIWVRVSRPKMFEGCNPLTGAPVPPHLAYESNLFETHPLDNSQKFTMWVRADSVELLPEFQDGEIELISGDQIIAEEMMRLVRKAAFPETNKD